MQTLLELLKRYAENYSFDTGDPENRTVLDQLFCAYQNSHETDPPEIKDGFKELDTYLRQLSLDDNDAVFTLCCNLCSICERNALLDGQQYQSCLMLEVV